MKDELARSAQTYGTSGAPRSAAASTSPSSSEEDFIIDEDANVILTAQGWVKRVREVKDLSTRACARATRCSPCRPARRARRSRSSRTSAAATSRRIARRPGVHWLRRPGAEAVQARRRRAHGRDVLLRPAPARRARPSHDARAEPEPPFAVAVTRHGLGSASRSAPPRALDARGPQVRAAQRGRRDRSSASCPGPKDTSICVRRDRRPRALGARRGARTLLSGAGKGTMLIKLDEDERLVGAPLVAGAKGAVVPVIETEKGKDDELSRQVERSSAPAGQGRRADEARSPVRRIVAPPESSPAPTPKSELKPCRPSPPRKR
jgi:DNA gyrase subunit A